MKSNKDAVIILRLSKEEKDTIKENCIKNGFTNLSEFMRVIGKFGKIKEDSFDIRREL